MLGTCFFYSWYVPCPGCCHRLVTMIGAWFYSLLVCTMLWLLLSSCVNAQSMVLYSVGMTMLWLLSSPSFNARSMFFSVFACTKLWLLLSLSDNARSMVFYSVGIYHALAVVIGQ